MLNAETPKNYVLSSGQLHSIRQFLHETLKCADIDFYRDGEDDKEKYFYKKKSPIMIINPEFYRPAEVHKLCGDYSLAQRDLGWEPKTKFEDLVGKMYKNDYDLLKSTI